MADTTTKTRTRLLTTRNGLPADTREDMVELLNQQLADTLDLFGQLKQAHWNVTGMSFQALHELFDEVAGSVQGFVDDIAERITALGGVAEGTVRMSAERSRLGEFPAQALSGTDAVSRTADAMAHVADSSRKAIDTAANAGDEVTADLFTEVARELDKLLWFVEAHTRK